MTIRDLAALSGYAVGTVSRVLNDQPNVSAAARERILTLAREQGFELNAAAKNLKQAHGNSILVVVRGVHNELFADLVERLQGLAAHSPYRLAVDYIDELADEVLQARRRVREIKPRGVLFLGGSSTNFAASFAGLDVPAVLVTNSAASLGFPRLSSVTTDDSAAAAAAIEYLIGLGHREFAVIGGDVERSDTSALRYRGCMAAFSRHGILFDPACRYHTARYSHGGGYEAMTQLLLRAPEVTAVFAMSDMMAIGAVRAACDRGRRVPEDVSVVGFDGLPICGYYVPRLTTVIQQTAFMAQESFRILNEAIHGDVPAQHILAPYSLAESDSSRRPGQRRD